VGDGFQLRTILEGKNILGKSPKKWWVTTPMNVHYANGNRDMMNFINDYTRMCWVYLLKIKSEAFEAFKSFHT